MAALQLSNAEARRVFLAVHGLSHAPERTPHDTMAEIQRLGFVQLDSIQTVARAHHHILSSRDTAYRPETLARLHHEERGVFEHWTHDASVIPMAFYPHWKRRFAAAKERAKTNAWWTERMGSRRILKKVLDRITAEGPLRTRDFEDKGTAGEMWGWGRSKTALEYLWHTGTLTIVKRDGFEKVYELAERVIPADLREAKPTKAQTADWACRAALERLGFASPREIAHFWALIPFDEVTAWVGKNSKKLIEVRIEGADGAYQNALALPALEGLRDAAPEPPAIMRALSPFDPAIRNRKRLKRLFDFDYTIEIFVPEPKRKFGYYVYPLLDGGNFVGRVDAKADRAGDMLNVKQIWHEPGIEADVEMQARERLALDNLARLGGVSGVRELA